MKNQNSDWLNDYEEFMQGEGAVPQQATAQVFGRIQNLLHPKALFVFVKILGLHLVTGFLSLSICHQFDMNPFGTHYSLDNWVMSFAGHEACMVFCGTLFVAITVFVAGYFLSVEEVRALKNNGFAQILSLGVISIGLFVAFGADLVLTFVLLWLLGVLIGGFGAMAAVWKLKTTSAISF